MEVVIPTREQCLQNIKDDKEIAKHPPVMVNEAGNKVGAGS